MLCNLSCILSSADFFQYHLFQKKKISGIPSVSNSLDPSQACHFVELDLDRNCLRSLSADGTSRQRVKVGVDFGKVNS